VIHGEEVITSADVSITINVLLNDVDVDGPNLFLTAVVCVAPNHGVVVVGGDRNITYTPNAGYVGPDQFMYKAYDGLSYSTCGPVTIMVHPGGGCGTPVEACGVPVERILYLFAILLNSGAGFF
jgi:hypothetical protein